MMTMRKVAALTDVERTRNWRRRLTGEKAAEVRIVICDDHDLSC